MYKPLLLIVATLFVGCHRDARSGPKAEGSSKPEKVAEASKPAAPAPELFQPLLLAQKPAQPLSVTDVLTKKAGEKVIVTGVTPPENVKPFNAAVAAFIMLSPDEMKKEEVADELSCEDAPTCPKCRKLLESIAVRVELVDKNGAVIPSTLEGVQNLKPGSTITVEGEVKRDGKDQKLVRIVATKFYPG